MNKPGILLRERTPTDTVIIDDVTLGVASRPDLHPMNLSPTGRDASIVRIVNQSKHALPNYATEHSAGMDLRANLDAPILLAPGQRALVKTGLFLELPAGTEAQVRPRSGLALKHGVTVLNAPGTIDADYRGEVGVILINHGQEPFEVKDGERIAQLVIARYQRVTFTEVADLAVSERGAGGFGHTGRN